jgi:hypothetical protein
MGFIPEWALGVGVIIVAVSVARAVSGIFRSHSRALPTSDRDADELRQAVDAMQTRMGELEERLDFTERLLAKYREPTGWDRHLVRGERVRSESLASAVSSFARAILNGSRSGTRTISA